MARTSDPELAERRKRQILDAALACFRRRGFHQASMQEICTQAQISAGALYRYFPSKTDLIAAIAADVQSTVEAALAHAEEDGDVAAALDDVAQMMFTDVFVPGDGALVADVMAEASRDSELAARLHDIDRRTRERFAVLLARAQAQGRVVADADPAVIAQLIFALIDGLGIKQCVSGEVTPEESLAVFRDAMQRYFTQPREPTRTPARKAARNAMPEDVAP